MKLILGLFLITFLCIQFSESNVIGNKKLETRIEKMWTAANKFMTNFENKLKAQMGCDERKDDNMCNLIRTKYNEYLTKVEEEARKANKLENINIELLFAQTMSDLTKGYKNKNIEKIKAMTKLDDVKKTELSKAMAGFYDSAINCNELFIDEHKTNPIDMFKKYSKKIRLAKAEKILSLNEKCTVTLEKESKNLGTKVLNMGLSYDILADLLAM